MTYHGPSWLFGQREKELLRSMASSASVKLPLSLFERDHLLPSDVTVIEEQFPKSQPIFPFLLALRPHLLIEKHVPSPEHVTLTARLREEDASRGISTPTWTRREQPFTFAGELRAVNRQLTAILNMVLTVAAAFVFGFYGIGYAYPAVAMNITLRAVLGLFFATIVFIADIYFVIKNMTLDEEVSRK